MSGASSPQGRIVALPVDGRPVVCEQVRQLASVAGWELVLPPPEALGHLRQPADRDALSRWLDHEAPRADAVILSLDMLLHGGLVPSRLGDEPLESLLPRLQSVRALARRQPRPALLAFAATMRISNNNVAEEERPYWATHGERLWWWSHERDRADATGDPEAAAAAAAAEAAIPATIRDDYRRTRARNHALNLAALDLVRDGQLDHLVLPQDDTARWGLNIGERRALQARVAALGLGDRVSIRPGADEVLHTLVARVVLARRPRPLRVAVSASDPVGYAAMTARYEDRALIESVAAQIAATGAVACAPDASPDLLLAVHTRGAVQGDWAMRLPLAEAQPVDPQWLQALADAEARGHPVAVVDLAFANGGDPWLVNALAPVLPPARWAAYAGWNTASNSLGSALAQAGLALAAGDRRATPAHQQHLALRLAEDLLYQAIFRQTWRLAHSGVLAEPPRVAANEVASLFIPMANAHLAAWGLSWRVDAVSLPWSRSFEIGLRLVPAPAGTAEGRAP